MKILNKLLIVMFQYQYYTVHMKSLHIHIVYMQHLLYIHIYIYVYTVYILAAPCKLVYLHVNSLRSYEPRIFVQILETGGLNWPEDIFKTFLLNQHTKFARFEATD